jgi:hypothetical protein
MGLNVTCKLQYFMLSGFILFCPAGIWVMGGFRNSSSRQGRRHTRVGRGSMVCWSLVLSCSVVLLFLLLVLLVNAIATKNLCIVCQGPSYFEAYSMLLLYDGNLLRVR